MRELNFIKTGELQWLDIPEPQLEAPSDALVRPLAAARCDGDKVFLQHSVTGLLRAGVFLHYVDPIARDLFGRRPFEGPFPIGHECVAEVVSCGAAVSGFAVGDLVVVPWSIACGSCLHCQRKLTSKCQRAGDTFLAGYGFGSALGPWRGMLADRIRVPYAQHMLVRVPEGVEPAAVASASDNIPDGWRAVAPQLEANPGAPVLVVGGGASSIGLYAAGIAVALGSERVDYVDYKQERLEVAASLGANPLPIPGSSRGRWYRKHAPARAGSYPITVDASSRTEGLRFAIRSLAPGGVCTATGYYFRKGTALPLMQMYSNCSSLEIGISHPHVSLPDVLRLIASGRFQPEKVTTLLADWADADQAFLADTVKVVVQRPRQLAVAVQSAEY